MSKSILVSTVLCLLLSSSGYALSASQDEATMSVAELIQKRCTTIVQARGVPRGADFDAQVAKCTGHRPTSAEASIKTSKTDVLPKPATDTPTSIHIGAKPHAPVIVAQTNSQPASASPDALPGIAPVPPQPVVSAPLNIVPVAQSATPMAQDSGEPIPTAPVARPVKPVPKIKTVTVDPSGALRAPKPTGSGDAQAAAAKSPEVLAAPLPVGPLSDTMGSPRPAGNDPAPSRRAVSTAPVVDVHMGKPVNAATPVKVRSKAKVVIKDAPSVGNAKPVDPKAEKCRTRAVAQGLKDRDLTFYVRGCVGM